MLSHYGKKICFKLVLRPPKGENNMCKKKKKPQHSYISLDQSLSVLFITLLNMVIKALSFLYIRYCLV